ncbi:hypothetical protein GJAV_G00098270 [Gymnothorax javanicus]|nr:hypothetical protein GJAV_G00098270 [Gymnothorax javanicus]
MGVHGLTSYIEENRRHFFDKVKLRNATLVIDGCSLYYKLFFTSGLDLQHGGDYEFFAKLIQQFFEALSICNIRPIVLLDGGIDYTDKKFSTLKQRAQSKIKEADALSRGSHGSILPLLTKVLFKQILCSLRVPFVQCFAEADWEIACLANQWNCAVLTADSDFFVFDLKGGYLPLGFFQWHNIGVCQRTSERYIPSLSFSITKFCSCFNRMNKELIPLFAVMCGNDYTSPGLMEPFFIRVNFPQHAGSRTQARINGLLHWLSQFNGPNQAVDAVLQIMANGATDVTRAELLSGMKEYKLSRSNLSEYFSHGALVANPPEPVRILPKWLQAALSSGRLPSLILDVLVLQRAMLNIQVENCRLPCSHEVSLPIRQVLYGLLLHGKGKLVRGRGSRQRRSAAPKEDSPHYYVQEFHRQDLDLRGSSVQAVVPGILWQQSLETLNEAPLPVRMQVVLETLGVEESIATTVPPHLMLPVCVTCYWLSNSKPKPDLPMVQALLLGVVYGELCRLGSSQRGRAAGYPGMQAACDRLGRLRVRVGERRGLNLAVAHACCQWQSCLQMSIYLNGLLSCPLPEPECAWLYSGTFVHGAVKEIRGGSSPELLLAGAPFIMQLYSTLLGALWSADDDDDDDIDKEWEAYKAAF